MSHCCTNMICRNNLMSLTTNITTWQQLQMYYGSGTDVTRARWASGQPADVAASGGQIWNDVMAAILNIWHHITNPTPSTNAYLLLKQSCQISSVADLKRQHLRLFWRQWPQSNDNNNNNNNNKSSDMRSVPDPKKHYTYILVNPL